MNQANVDDEEDDEEDDDDIDDGNGDDGENEEGNNVYNEEDEAAYFNEMLEDLEQADGSIEM